MNDIIFRKQNNLGVRKRSLRLCFDSNECAEGASKLAHSKDLVREVL
jgi:hypothetical protein